jgi:hypothetical protein
MLLYSFFLLDELVLLLKNIIFRQIILMCYPACFTASNIISLSFCKSSYKYCKGNIFCRTEANTISLSFVNSSGCVS